MEYKTLKFSEDELARIREMRASGASFRQIGKAFDICKDTAKAIGDGTWTPRIHRLAVDDATLYLDWLMLGSYTAVARKYGTTDKTVGLRVRTFCRQQGIEA